jgi:DNA-binding SARP family transcriptional activator
MLHVNLFGKFDIQDGDGAPIECKSLKSKELFAYLLLNRDRPHAREKVASLLWGGHCTTAQSKKYLRNALWQLQSALIKRSESSGGELLLVEPDWIQLNSVPALQLDVHIFEAVYRLVEGLAGYNFKKREADKLDEALQLYKGDVLESWYQDWCLHERERMLQIYLILLDKMMIYSEASGQFEKGLAYGRHILHHDRARECTHRRLMRLYYLRGDRCTALRQYEQCATTLREELDVEPSQRTTALYEQLRTDRLDAGPRVEQKSEIEGALRALRSLQARLTEVQRHMQRTAKTVSAAIQKR